MNEHLKLNENLFEESGKIVDDWIENHPGESPITLIEDTLQKLLDAGVNEISIQILYLSIALYSSKIMSSTMAELLNSIAGISLEKCMEEDKLYREKFAKRISFKCIKGGNKDELL